ncbi:MAG: DUF1926 domain-containing protein, partial [Anaerolineae bacterium]|nr:DUF1926 domain-containing protein [Anaerolineae bacterium]
AFLDHFLREDVTVEGVYRASYGEQGNFVNLPYTMTIIPGAKECKVTLQRDGHVWVGDIHCPVRVSKTFTFVHGADTFHIAYTVRNLAERPIDVRFAVETASAFDGGQDAAQCHYMVNGAEDQPHSLHDRLTHEAVTAHTTISTIRGIAFTTRSAQPCALWTFPLDTVTMSEAGYERGYQGTVYLHVWALHLAPDAVWEGSLSQTVAAYKQ